ncbi:MAG TPA: hypothetical protein VIY29_04520, partial [Ktedonobacteraceae bacterium]
MLSPDRLAVFDDFAKVIHVSRAGTVQQVFGIGNAIVFGDEELLPGGQIWVQQRVIKGAQAVAFSAFAHHRHRSGHTQNIEAHFRKIVVRIFHLAWGQHAKVELGHLDAVAQCIGAGLDVEIARVIGECGRVTKWVGVTFGQIEVLRGISVKASNTGAYPILPWHSL